MFTVRAIYILELDIESEAAVRRCSVKKNFSKFSLVKIGTLAPVFSCEFCEI